MSTFRLAVSYENYYGLNQRPPLPDWLYKGRDVSHLSGGGVSFNYWTKIYWATPPWLSPEMYYEMKAIYDSALEDEHVDHIVPLKHNLVCGLHVPQNLRVINGKKNLVKSNNYWPDCPFHQPDLFDNEELPDHMYADFYDKRNKTSYVKTPLQLSIFDIGTQNTLEV